MRRVYENYIQVLDVTGEFIGLGHSICQDGDGRCYMYTNINKRMPDRHREIMPSPFMMYIPKKIIQNNPATIVYWLDGSKTVVKCKMDEDFDPYKGLAMAFMKKACGSKFHEVLKQAENGLMVDYTEKTAERKTKELQKELAKGLGGANSPAELFWKTVNDQMDVWKAVMFDMVQSAQKPVDSSKKGCLE